MYSAKPDETEIADFFQKLADAFLAGDHEWLAGIYIYPLVVYIENDITLERSPEKTLANLFERREIVLRGGTRSVKSNLISVGKPDTGRFPVRVDWEFLDAEGRQLTRNQLRYFCRFDELGNIRIEILEFLKQGFPTSPQDPGATTH